MTLPTFLVIGAAKAGTTSLYHALGEHPQVFMSPRKETNFFALRGGVADFRGPGDAQRVNRDSVTDLDAYRELFRGADATAVGEASPLYLYSPRAAGEIHRLLPQVRLIAILRDPVERAFSSFLHLRRDGREPESDFDEALDREPERIARGWEHLWHYQAMGFYGEQLSRYLELFPRDRLAVYLYDDLIRDPDALLRSIFAFLGVDPEVTIDTRTRRNVSGLPSNRPLHEFLARPHPLKSLAKPFLPIGLRKRLKLRALAGNLRRPQLELQTRRRLGELYRSDVERLETLIERDLSAWLR